MTTRDYLIGIVDLATVVVAWSFAAWQVRAAVLPAIRGAQARLVESIVGLSGLLVTTEIIGAFAGFVRLSFVILMGAIGAAIGIAARRYRPLHEPVASTMPPPREWLRLIAPVAAVIVVTAQWLSGVAQSYREGIVDIDSLNYHLPHAAYFVQTESLWKPHEVSAGADAAFHPLNVELLHGIGMLLLRSDFLSLFINLGFLWLLLLAAWVVGERVAAGPAAIAATALLAATVPLGGVSGGTAENDVGVLVFLLAAVAFADHATVAPRSQERHSYRLLAGLALGLAIGTKLSTPGVVVALVVGWLWMWGRRRPLRHLWALLVPIVVTGSFWYIRDWALFGNPVPAVNLKVGGIGFTAVPMPGIAGTTFTVAHYATDLHIVRHWYIPALRYDFGDLWPLILGLPLLGVLSALRPGRSRPDRLIAAAAVVGFAFYLVTPSGAEGLPGMPALFGSNVRYVTPALLLGLIALVRDPWLARQRWLPPALVALEIVMIVPRRFWPGGFVHSGVAGAVVIAFVVAILAAVAMRSRRLACSVALAGVVAVAIGGLPVERRYLNHRYSSTGTPTQALLASMQGLAGAQIGAAGFPILYPFYGQAFTNSVSYIGQSAPHHAFNDFESCADWVSAVNDGDYQYVVVLLRADGMGGYQRFALWTHRTGAARIFDNPAGSVYEIRKPLNAARCPAAPA